MANADHISDASEQVSIILTAISDLADVLIDVPPTGLSRPYSACLAFKLLSGLAADRLAVVEHALNRELLPMKRDMERVAKAAA